MEDLIMSNDNIRLDESKFGLGVFANKEFKRGQYILTLTGKLITEAESLLDQFVDSHSIQVGPNLYLGPGNDMDDYLNHSCDPNSGVKKDTEASFILKAIKHIYKDEEITFDYSTTIEDGWTLQCGCGTKRCRKVVGRWSALPENVKRYYRFEGVALADTFSGPK